jgi:hypothetical protein
MGGAQPDTLPILERMATPLAANTQPSILMRIAPSILADTAPCSGRLAAIRPTRRHLDR